MLTIRMQRTGRKGHAQFRVVVQDSRLTPTSGKIVAALGSYDPHAKTTTLNKEKAAYYLEHGAQPSPRAVKLLLTEGVKLPEWVKTTPSKANAVRNPEKRRSTTPAAPEAPAEEVVEEAATPEVEAETPADAEVSVEATAETTEETSEV
jgi:small subunit ribosomal protein S16